MTIGLRLICTELKAQKLNSILNSNFFEIDFEETSYENFKDPILNGITISSKTNDENLTIVNNFFGGKLYSVLIKKLSNNLNTQIYLQKMIDAFEPLICFYYDYYYEYWQSANQISEYEVYNRPHEHLPKLLDKYGDEEIDITNNLGKSVLINDIYITPANKIWINLNSKKFNITLVTKFIKENNLPHQNNGNYLEFNLFQNIEESNLPDNQIIQNKFIQTLIKEEWINK